MPQIEDYDGPTKKTFLSNIASSLREDAKFINEAVFSLRRRESKTILLVGKYLIEVHKKIARHGSGTFDAWVMQELTIGKTTAHKWRKVVEVFGDRSSCERIEPSALYLLSADTTPERARKRALKHAEKGERVRHLFAKKIVQEELERERRKSRSVVRDARNIKSIEAFDKLVELRRRFSAIWRQTNKDERRRYKKWEYSFRVKRGYRRQSVGLTRQQLREEAA